MVESFFKSLNPAVICKGMSFSNVAVKYDRQRWDSPLSSLCPNGSRESAKIRSTGNQSTQATEIIGTYTLLTFSTALHSVFYSDSIVMWPKAGLFNKKKIQKCMTLPWSLLLLAWSITNYKVVVVTCLMPSQISCVLRWTFLTLAWDQDYKSEGTPTSPAQCLQGCFQPCFSNFCSTSTCSFLCQDESILL